MQGVTHQDLQAKLLKAATKLKATLYVNRRGFGWVGQLLSREGQFTTLRNARRIEIGMTNGSSDLVGATRILITPEMVGRTVAVFTAAEVKAGRDKLTEDQVRWLANVTAWGGIACECRDVADLEVAIEKFKKGEQ